MARSGAKKHVHRYFRLPIDGLWHCGDARCTHYMPSNMPAPVYKDSICWGCGRVFELNPVNMKDEHPVCDRCPKYDAQLPPPEVHDDVTAWIEEKEREARMKKFVPPTGEEEVESEVAHTAECATWSGKPCDCM